MEINELKAKLEKLIKRWTKYSEDESALPNAEAWRYSPCDAVDVCIDELQSVIDEIDSLLR